MHAALIKPNDKLVEHRILGMNWRKVIEDRRGMLIDKENAYTELICSYRRRLATY
jgi:hypothetical protein